MQTLLAILLVLLSLFLILLILIQQGKGGGLAGAFGGMGGQSAFGTKAGDLFTKITIGVAGVWIVLCILLVRVTGSAQSGFSDKLGGSAPPLRRSLRRPTQNRVRLLQHHRRARQHPTRQAMAQPPRRRRKHQSDRRQAGVSGCHGATEM